MNVTIEPKNSMDKLDAIGFVKYEGPRVATGAFDARKSAKALIGLDDALRHFVVAQLPDLKSVDFEIPVRIQKGSWIASIPTDVSTLITLGASIATTAYVTNAAKKMAEKDFDGVGLRDIFRSALNALKWVARIGKHLGNIRQRRFEKVKFSEDNELVGIPNEKGVYLYVPVRYLEMYANCRPDVLEKLAANIDAETVLSVGVYDADGIDEESIDVEDKLIFADEEEEVTDELLFPELVHGAAVSLIGEVTRENKMSQSMGFRYQNHVLTAYPEGRNIVPFKPMLFETCQLVGVVDRTDENGRIGARRPKLIFSNLFRVSPKSGDLFES